MGNGEFWTWLSSSKEKWEWGGFEFEFQFQRRKFCNGVVRGGKSRIWRRDVRAEGFSAIGCGQLRKSCLKLFLTRSRLGVLLFLVTREFIPSNQTSTSPCLSTNVEPNRSTTIMTCLYFWSIIKSELAFADPWGCGNNLAKAEASRLAARTFLGTFTQAPKCTLWRGFPETSITKRWNRRMGYHVCKRVMASKENVFSMTRLY